MLDRRPFHSKHSSLRSPRDRFGAARRGIGYGAVLLAGVSLATMLLADGKATAQNQPVQLAQAPPPGQDYFNRDIDRLAKEADAAVKKGDPKAANAAIRKLKEALQLLDVGVKTGAIKDLGATFDLLKLNGALPKLEADLAKNAGPNLLDGLDGASYGFFIKGDLDFAKVRYDAALAAAKKCDEAAFAKAVGELKRIAEIGRRRAQQERAKGTAEGEAAAAQYEGDARTFDRLAGELEAGKAKLFEACKKPEDKSAETPKPIEPPKGPQAPVPRPPGDQASRPMQNGSPFGAAFTPNIFVIEPGFAIGPSWFGGDAHYASNGGQAPGSGTGRRNGGDACIGFDMLATLPFGFEPGSNGGPPVMVGNPSLGLGFGYCEFLAANVLLYQLDRHSGGLVSFAIKERNELYFEFLMQMLIWIRTGDLFGPSIAQYASTDSLAQAGLRGRGNYWPVRFKFGIGPVFRSSTVTLTSNQVPGGGVLETASQTKRQTGLGLVFGASTPICRNCVFGNPLMFNVEGRIRYMPSRDVAVTSSTFGFTETATLERRTTSSVIFKISVPIGIGRF